MIYDLQKLLKEDNKYKQILENLSKEEKEALEKYMDHFMKAWQEGVFNPLVEASQKEEFSSELRKKIEEK